MEKPVKLAILLPTTIVDLGAGELDPNFWPALKIKSRLQIFAMNVQK